MAIGNYLLVLRLECKFQFNKIIIMELGINDYRQLITHYHIFSVHLLEIDREYFYLWNN